MKALFPRLYLDTNVLIEAILESEPGWLKKNPQEREKRESIDSSLELYNNRHSLKLITSAFSIAEFIAQGRKQEFGGKTFENMIDIVNSKILPPNIDIIHSSLSFKQTPKIDKKWEKYWLFAELKVKGNAIDDEGKPIGIMDFSFLIDLWGRTIQSWGGGVPANVTPIKFHPKLTKINVSSYSAPAFEIMLFYEATKIAIDVGLKLPDAIHILCAKGNADIVVTNDKSFYEKWQTKPRLLGVSVKSSRETLSMLKKWKYSTFSK